METLHIYARQDVQVVCQLPNVIRVPMDLCWIQQHQVV
jgi:hypothetical protein